MGEAKRRQLEFLKGKQPSQETQILSAFIRAVSGPYAQLLYRVQVQDTQAPSDPAKPDGEKERCLIFRVEDPWAHMATMLQVPVVKVLIAPNIAPLVEECVLTIRQTMGVMLSRHWIESKCWRRIRERSKKAKGKKA